MATCLWEAGFAVTDPGDAICTEDWAPNKLFGGGEYSSGVTTRQWLRSALNASGPCNLADNRPDECDFQVWYSTNCFLLTYTSLAALDKLVSAQRTLTIADVPNRRPICRAWFQHILGPIRCSTTSPSWQLVWKTLLRTTLS